MDPLSDKIIRPFPLLKYGFLLITIIRFTKILKFKYELIKKVRKGVQQLQDKKIYN